MLKTATPVWPSCFLSIVFPGAASVCRHRGPRVAFPEFCGIALSQSVHQLLMKIVVARGDRRGDSLVIHLPRSIDVFTQTIVKVAVASPVLNFRFVVKFDFRNQQTSKPASVVVQAPLFF